MKTETRHDTPYFTADPRMVQPMFHEDEPCHDPGTCYPSDDGEADMTDPGPTPVTGGPNSPLGAVANQLEAGIFSALAAFFGTSAARPFAFAAPANA